MKAITMMVSIALLVGCSNSTKTDVFNTGKVNYEKVNDAKAVERAETRVFVKNGAKCNYRSNDKEGGVIVLAVASFVVKQGTEYLAQYLTDKANYLKSDITLHGKSLINTSSGTYWPTEANLTIEKQANLDKKEAVRKNYELFMNTNSKKNEESESAFEKRAQNFAKKEGDRVSQESLKNPKIEIKSTKDDLCILLVAGNYKSGGGKEVTNKIVTDFQKGNTAFPERIFEYRSPLPMVDAAHTPKPFDDLIDDPSMVLEMHVVSTEKPEKLLITVVPTNLFYPYPLHKGTVSSLERKVTIKTKLGSNEPTVILEHLKSGAVYGVEQLARNYVQFEVDKTAKFTDVEMTVAEGPDKMPTAKALEAAAANKDKVNDYLIEKLTERLGTDEQKAAQKK